MNWLQHIKALAVALEGRAEHWICYMQYESEPLVRHPVERDHSVSGGFSARNVNSSAGKVRITFVPNPTLEQIESIPDVFFRAKTDSPSPRSAWLIPFFSMNGFADKQSSPLLRWSFLDCLELEGFADASEASVRVVGSLFADLASFKDVKAAAQTHELRLKSSPGERESKIAGNLFSSANASESTKEEKNWHEGDAPDSILSQIDQWQQGMRHGDYYLANATTRMIGPARDSTSIPLSAFVGEWLDSPVRHGVFVDCGEKLPRVCCFSPERFVSRSADKIQTEPIKGTLHFEIGKELHAAHELWKSEKEMSEQTMVTDLLRNDFNKICRPGSVVVSSPFEIRVAGKLLQMQSVVEGNLQEKMSSNSQILAALLPAGSVTGTPKWAVSSQIVNSETMARGYYTGVFALSRSPEDFESTVLIRGFFADEVRWYAGIGAGVTTLSDPQSEVDEFRLKWKSFADRWSRLTRSAFRSDKETGVGS